MDQDKLSVCDKKNEIQKNILYTNVRVQYSTVCSDINAESGRKNELYSRSYQSH